MGVCYLEVDDEITGAIARIRSIRDGEAIIVVPAGSRIATSRINFKLLAREAVGRRLNAVAVSDDPQVRALAISAGLPAYDSVPSAEQALAGFRDQDRRLAERVASTSAGAADAAKAQPGSVRDAPGAIRERGQAGRKESSTPRRDAASERSAQRPVAAAGDLEGMTPQPLVDAPSVAGTPWTEIYRPTGQKSKESGSPSETFLAERDAGRKTSIAESGSGRARRRFGIWPVLLIVLAVLLVAGVAYGAYALLPTATVTLRPASAVFSPEGFSVTADPNVAVADAAAGVIPAQSIDIPLSVEREFSSTGINATETKAEGVARFRSENTLNDVAIPQGTLISTADGIQFETTEPASVPRADFATATPGTVDVAIRAVRGGPRGNVAADAISELPNSLRGQLVSVHNQAATTGGQRVEEPVVTQHDYDAAVTTLGEQLELVLADALRDPATTPRGLTMFFETAETGNPEPDPAAAELVGTLAPTFTLKLASIGRVVMVNEALVDELAANRLRAALPAGRAIVGDQVSTERSAGDVAGRTVVYRVASTAAVYELPNSADIVGRVRGKSVAEAKQILSPYGMVDITLWPEFIDRIPDQSARIALVVVPPSAPSSVPTP